MKGCVRTAVECWANLTKRLNGVGDIVPPLILRAILGWEFFESGLEKLRGQNWFSDIQAKFPFPFDLVPAGFSWQMATWSEIVGAILLWLGLGTRFAAFSLLVLTFVATSAVHWPGMWQMWDDLLKGYAISDDGYGNFKLPLLFIVMLLPLIFRGAGVCSVDYLIWRQASPAAGGAEARVDAAAWAISFFVLGIPMLFLLPWFGSALVGAAFLLLASHALWRHRGRAA